MILPILCVGCLLSGPNRVDISMTRTSEFSPSLFVSTTGEPLQKPKRSPKSFPPGDQPYEFLYSIDGKVSIDGIAKPVPRFQVFCQEDKDLARFALPSTRLLLRLWEYNYTRLRLDHKPAYRDRTVDVYFCYGGEPGGEQLFDSDPDIERGRSRSVNTVYIYDLPSFKQTIEKVREVSHEYGHASLPAIGGYLAPEYWANGFLGEKLFLKWLYADLKSGVLKSDDVMGLDHSILEKWIDKEVTPLIDQAAVRSPKSPELAGTGSESMSAYMGLTLWMEQILPAELFSRALRTQQSIKATDFPTTVSEALRGSEPFECVIPIGLRKKTVWVPFGESKLKGIQPIKRIGGWIQIRGEVGKFTVVPPT